jgi:hypothetical protein
MLSRKKKERKKQVQNPENPSCPSGKSLRVSADAVVVRG